MYSSNSWTYKTILTQQDNREKNIPMITLWCPAFCNMADFIMPEIQQILIIYSPYLLKDLVEL